MPPSTALHTIGFYCGRHGPGLFDEPQNVFSNLAFLAGAAWACHLWRRDARADRFLGVLIALLAGIGVGSFIFHSHPTPVTLYIDLVPIQVYILAMLAYALTRVLGCLQRQTIAVLVLFFCVRQAWLVFGPSRLLGGGGTHIPTLAAELILLGVLIRRGSPLWKYLAAGAGLYALALFIRSWDVPLCARFPLGLHWAWHVTSAAASTLLLVGLIRTHRPAGPATGATIPRKGRTGELS